MNSGETGGQRPKQWGQGPGPVVGPVVGPVGQIYGFAIIYLTYRQFEI